MRKMIAGLLACVVLLCAFAPFACAADGIGSMMSIWNSWSSVVMLKLPSVMLRLPW